MILHNVRLIDGTGQVLEKCHIRIDEEVIASVSTEPMALEPGAEELDLEGRTVIPGLINCHTHICLEPSPDPQTSLLQTSLAENVIATEKRMPRMLRAGITTVRDLGGYAHIDIGLKRAIEKGLTQGPRLLVSGRLLAMTGGHGYWLGREVDGPAEVCKGAREEIKAGADVVKVMATGGVMTLGTEPGAPQLSYEEMAVAVEEARKAGRRTAAHAQASEGILNAVRAGIDSIEHGHYLSNEAIALMAEKGTYLVPTLAALYRILQHGEDAGIPSFMVDKSRRANDAQLDSVRRAYEAGVFIAAGNDGGTPFNPHDDLATELELLVQIGLEPAEALAAATSGAAALLRLSDEVGTVEAGKQADLVILGADPLTDISAVRNVEMVVQAGRIVYTRSAG